MKDTLSLKQRLLDKNKWIRILFILIFAALFWVTKFVIAIAATLQAIITLFSHRPNANLVKFGKSLGLYCQQLVEYQLWAGDFKPFPFGEYPQVDAEPPKASSSAQKSKQTTKVNKAKSSDAKTVSAKSTAKSATAKKADTAVKAKKKPPQGKTTR